MRITREIQDTDLAAWLQSASEEDLAAARAEIEAEHELAAVMDARLVDDPQFVSAEEGALPRLPDEYDTGAARS